MMEPRWLEHFEAALAISSRRATFAAALLLPADADLAARHPSRRCELERAAIAQPPKKKRKRDVTRGVLLAIFFDADRAAAPAYRTASR